MTNRTRVATLEIRIDKAQRKDEMTGTVHDYVDWEIFIKGKHWPLTAGSILVKDSNGGLDWAWRQLKADVKDELAMAIEIAVRNSDIRKAARGEECPKAISSKSSHSLFDDSFCGGILKDDPKVRRVLADVGKAWLDRWAGIQRDPTLDDDEDIRSQDL